MTNFVPRAPSGSRGQPVEKASTFPRSLSVMRSSDPQKYSTTCTSVLSVHWRNGACRAHKEGWLASRRERQRCHGSWALSTGCLYSVPRCLTATNDNDDNDNNNNDDDDDDGSGDGDGNGNDNIAGQPTFALGLVSSDSVEPLFHRARCSGVIASVPPAAGCTRQLNHVLLLMGISSK